MVDMANGLIVGAYAAHAPGRDTGSSAIVRALAAHPAVMGLEVPQLDRVSAGADWKQGWSHVITAIPGTMGRIATNPAFGLASPDPSGRAAALAFAADLRDDVTALVAHGHQVQAVELHSGPSHRAEPDAMRDSMRTISAWDWPQGMILVLEHGDATTADHTGEKAFLDFATELTLVQEAAADDPRWRIGINWGRSALEGRNADLPLAHITTAADAGLLGALFFSSASGEVSSFGEPWIDLHLPPAGLAFSPAGTLLGTEEIRAALDAAGEVPVLGVKFGLRPLDLDEETRAAHLVQIIDLVTSVR